MIRKSGYRFFEKIVRAMPIRPKRIALLRYRGKVVAPIKN
jgi:hypothetical protein